MRAQAPALALCIVDTGACQILVDNQMYTELEIPVLGARGG